MDDNYKDVSPFRLRLLYLPLVGAFLYCLWGYASGTLVLPSLGRTDPIQISPGSIPSLCLSLAVLLIAQVAEIEKSIPIPSNLRRPVFYSFNAIGIVMAFLAITGRI